MKEKSPYPAGFVRRLLQTDEVTPATRAALEGRLRVEEAPRRFFDPFTFGMLQLVCDRLLDQDPEQRLVHIASAIDDRFCHRTSDGWRYDSLPPDEIAYRQAMLALNESARQRYDRGFADLDKEAQLALLRSVQDGSITGPQWAGLATALFFEELLAEATEIFYSHPSAQEEIGYAGMADAKGWRRIGLNEREDREPEAGGKT